MRVGLVLGVCGTFLRLFALAFVPPLALAAWDGATGAGELVVAAHFAVAFGATLLAGTLLARLFARTPFFRRSEALGVVAGTWLLVAVFGSVPYLFAGLSPVDAFFESMSGFTTTGATVLEDFGRYGQAFYLWRALTQWFGGLGVIALFVVVLPRLGIAGRQLFFAEASTAPGEAIGPQIRQVARRLWALYLLLTAAETALLVLSGFPLYDAVVHSLTTMSAGGFSPHGESIGGYQNAPAEWVIVVFMLLAGTSYPLLYRVLSGRPWLLLRDKEFVAYLALAVGISVAVSAVLAAGLPGEQELREGFFNVVSLVSCTGYANADFAEWGAPAKVLLLLAFLVGGCAGSAAGGPKVVRWLLLGRFLRREVRQVLHPQAVIPLRYKGGPVPREVLRAVIGLVFLYLAGWMLVGGILVLLGSDMEAGFTAAIAAFYNTGPGLGAVGPMANYAHLGVEAKLVLCAAMWAGRLEIVTVIALLHPHVWRQLEWRGAPAPPA